MIQFYIRGVSFVAKYIYLFREPRISAFKISLQSIKLGQHVLRIFLGLRKYWVVEREYSLDGIPSKNSHVLSAARPFGVVKNFKVY